MKAGIWLEEMMENVIRKYCKVGESLGEPT